MITGASQGIVLAIAHAFAAAHVSYLIFLAGFTEALSSALKDAHPTLAMATFSADITDPNPAPDILSLANCGSVSSALVIPTSHFPSLHFGLKDI